MLEQRYKNYRVILRKLSSRISDRECVSASSAVLSLQRDFAVIKALGRSVENNLWRFLLFENLNPESQKTWETSNDGTEALDFDRFMVFLDNRVRSLEAVERSHSRPHKPKREQQMFLTEKNRSHKNELFLPQCKV